MRTYLQRLWRTRRGYIIIFGLLLITLLIRGLSNTKSINGAGLGIVCGALLFFTLFFGPVIYFDAKNSKVTNPKDRFIEPPLRVLIPLNGLAAIVSFGLFLLLLNLGPVGTFMSAQLAADSFVAGVIMMFTILACLFGPGAFYTIYIRRHYKKVIEYNTAEWRKLHSIKH